MAALLLCLALLFTLAACGTPTPAAEPTPELIPTPEPTPTPVPTPPPTPTVESIIIRFAPEERELTEFTASIYEGAISLDAVVTPTELRQPVVWSSDDDSLFELTVDPMDGNRCSVKLLQPFTGARKIYAELGAVKAECIVYCRDEAAPTELPEGAAKISICYAGLPLTEFTTSVEEAAIPLRAQLEGADEDAVVTWRSENDELLEITVDPEDGNRCHVKALDNYSGSLMIYAEWEDYSAECRVYCAPPKTEG